MKKHLLPLFLVLLAFYSCKKVDDANAYKQTLPSIVNDNFNYKTDFIVGDTMTLSGRLFFDSGSLHIRIGNAEAEIVAHSQSKVSYYGNPPVVFDRLKLVITEQMGTGKDIPVTITANGNVLHAPAVNISQFIALSGRTDTTLFVDKLVTWAPENLDSYQYDDTANYQVFTLPYIIHATVNQNGDMAFFNPTGIFQVSDNQVKPVLSKGDSFTEDGQEFSIRYVVGSTNTADPNVFYFSAEVLEDSPGADELLIYRLCKYDAVSKSVTTINRSTLYKRPDGKTITAAPFQGDAASVKLVASDLKMSTAGELYFLNSYSVATDYYSQDGYHTFLTVTGQYKSGSPNNLCTYVDGKISSLFSSHNYGNVGFEGPGIQTAAIDDYLVSPDGTSVLTTNAPGALDKLAMYDLSRQSQVYTIGNKTFKFESFDDNPATQFSQKTFSSRIQTIDAGYIRYNAFLLNGVILPNEEIVYAAGYGLASYNYLANAVYGYAGREGGLTYSTDPSQLSDMGKASMVNFSGRYVYGIDRLANIYFFAAAIASDYTTPTPVTFYKMYSKK